jgi:cobalt/nickel transport system ATP-binding protein
LSHHIVEAKELQYAYPDGTKALNSVTFRITHGESVGIVGANGAGKSTLLLHLNGCLLPSAGTLQVGDYLLSRGTVSHIRGVVGTVFQDSDDQLFMPTVGEDVAFGPANMGLPPEDVESRTSQALDAVKAAHLRKRPPYRLSGGEKRAAAIATVLAMSPAILVMDEPSSSLDPQARRRLIGLLRTFTHTKIVATHDLDLVMDLSQRTIVLYQGRVLADGQSREILSDEALMTRAGLEQPFRLQGCPKCGSRFDNSPAT